MSDTQEIVQRLEHEMAQRATAVEKVDAFKAQFNQAIKAFMAADGAVRGLNDHDSEVDTQIATAIDEHLRAVDRLCRFGIDGGFGECIGAAPERSRKHRRIDTAGKAQSVGDWVFHSHRRCRLLESDGERRAQGSAVCCLRDRQRRQEGVQKSSDE